MQRAQKVGSLLQLAALLFEPLDLRHQRPPVELPEVLEDCEFGKLTGVPVLVNTSFNGFSEPMVCSPRDAIRVFFGTGFDLLVLDRFVVRK